MKSKITYFVKANIIRYKSPDDIDFEIINQRFENENPIVAREQALEYYQNYIDVLLENKGIKYQSDEQAREELNSFFKETTFKRQQTNVENEYGSIYLPYNGIGVYFVADIPKADDALKNMMTSLRLHDVPPIDLGDDEGGNLIHGIGNYINGKTDSILLNLEEELRLYKKFNYDTQSKEKQIIYCDRGEWEEGYREDEPGTYAIIETPFDWSGLDKPYWWGEPNEEDSVIEEVSPTIEDIIENGEGNDVEFKPSLLYNFNTRQAGIGVKSIIAKAICAFLNSNGGLLFLGVNDKKIVQGLNDYDFSLACGKDPKDFFLLEFDDMIKQFIGFSFMPLIKSSFHEINKKTIFIVVVNPCYKNPAFLKAQGKKEFWMRASASNRQITDIEEIINYFLNRHDNQK